MFLLTTSSNGSRGSGFQRRPLTPAEAPPVSCTVRMGALCWVLPEEDEEVLEEGGGAGVLRKPLETSCWKNPGNGLIIQNLDRDSLPSGTISADGAAESDVPRNLEVTKVDLQLTSPAPPDVCQHLCKVVQELVDTEKSYVKDLLCLFDTYLMPLQSETFLSQDEMEALFGSLPEMLDFQRVFLQTLEDRIQWCPNFSSLEPGQVKELLCSLGGCFLFYADGFKHYGGFCANHVKVQKVLERAKTDRAFKVFLEAKNPTNQHSSSLESYLIKPVQRLLKYPLLLRELVSLTDPDSPEHAHLTEALRAMEQVASHINQMQQIYEDFGPVFEHLAAEQSGPHKQVTEISMAEFLLHSSVVWLNPLPRLGRRKEPKLTLFVFQRAVVLVRRGSSMRRRLAASRPADLEAFGFYWLIPVSAVQIRHDDTMAGCFWELVHCQPEGEGPERVFQLCSSGLETKASVVRALRSLMGGGGSLRRPRQGPPGSRGPAQQPGSGPGPAFSSGGRSFSRGPSPTDVLHVLEEDFSVQSLTSIITEDCFYDPRQEAPPMLKLAR